MILREKKKPVIGKEYFNYMNLEGIVAAYPYRKNLPEEDIIKERQIRLALIDFLRGLVEFDPAKRWSPFQASKHPFVTGEPFTCPYKPPPETPRVPVSQNFKVDHHPGGGHWFAAGLSPNVPGRALPMHAGPLAQIASYAHGSSYGSLGSHNSYNDCNGLGSSYGSYGDNFNAFSYFSPVGPSAMNIHGQGSMTMVGTSPDARWRILHRPQGLVASPSAGNFTPLPLGVSPSQFTPPNNFTQVSGSPGHYGSASPARGNCHGSPLGKGVTISHMSRRIGWGYSGNLPSQEGSSSHWQGQLSESTVFSQGDSNTQVSGCTPHMSFNSNLANWKQPHRNCNFVPEQSFSSMPSSSVHGSSLQFSRIQGAADEKFDSTALPDPGDWDPNYSDELLLQEDNSDASGIASNFSEVHIDQAIKSPRTFGGTGRFNHDSNTCSNSSLRRLTRPNQGFSKPEVGSPPSLYNLPPGYGHSMSKAPVFPPQLSPTSSSRLGQPPNQRPSLGRSSAHGNEGSHMKLQHSSFGHGPANPRSPGRSSFYNGTSWGRRTNPLANIPPSSRGRKDYGRIA